MNSELCRKALEKVGNANTLINVVSRRVRQLTTGSGGISRPLIADVGTMGAADIAMTELIEDKMTWEAEEPAPVDEKAPKKRRKS